VAAQSGVDRARAFGDRFASASGEDIKAYGSYDELAADGDVDAVYVGTLNDTHVNTAIQFLEAGKAVLLEKPAAPTAAELDRILDAARANGAFFQEAVWTRFMPSVKYIRELLAEGALGEVSYLHADIGFVCDDGPDTRMMSPAHYGGGLMDVGVYPVQFGTMAFGSDVPVQVQATGQLGETGVDTAGAALCTFGGKGIASLSWSLLAESHEELLIVGSKGRVRLAKPSHCSELLTVELDQGARGGHVAEKLEFPFPPATGMENYPNSQALVYEVEGVSAAVLEGKNECAEFTWAESRRNAEIVEEIRRQVGIVFPDVDSKSDSQKRAAHGA